MGTKMPMSASPLQVRPQRHHTVQTGARLRGREIDNELKAKKDETPRNIESLREKKNIETAEFPVTDHGQ